MTFEQSESSPELRRRAEKKLKSGPAAPQQVQSLDEANRLLHELQVHQIELEMQNEELLRAQLELEALRARYFDLYDLAPVGYCTLSEKGLIQEANLSAATMLGAARGNMVNRPISRYILREDQNIYYHHITQLLETGEPRACELRMMKKDGTVFWALLAAATARVPSTHPGQDADSSSVIRIVLNDISERKRDEALLNGQKRVLELVAAGAPLQESLTALVSLIEEHASGMLCWILLLDKDGVHLRYGAAPTLPPEFTAAADGIAIGPNAGSCGTAAYRKEAVFVEDIATDPLWNEFKAMALPYGLRACWSTPIFDAGRGVLGTFAMFYRQPALPQRDHRRLIDIATQTAAVAIVRHRMETALQESEEFHRLTLNNISDAIFLTDDAGSFSYICPNVDIIFGYSFQEVQAMGNILRLLGEDLFSPGEFATLRELKNIERDITDKNGRIRSLLVNVKRISIKGGTRLYVCHDITERKRAEEALRENQARLDLALRAAVMGVWHWDIIENKHYSDDQVCHLLGINPAMFTGTAEEFFESVHPEDRETVNAALARTIEEDVLYEPEYRAVWPDGSVHYITARGRLVRDNEGRPLRINGIIWDITDRKRMEEELRKLNEELEQRVRERTKELERRNYELEQMNKAFVGRELRMVELKKRIRELEERVAGSMKR